MSQTPRRRRPSRRARGGNSTNNAPIGVSESGSDARISTGIGRLIAPAPSNWSQLLSSFPTRLITRNKYTEIIDIPTAAASAATYLFNLNSTFDPNRTGTGHQPTGRDVLVQIYNRYRVHRVDWKIEVAPAAAQEFCIVPQNHANTYTDIDTAGEQPHSVLHGGTTTTNMVRFTGGCMLHLVNGQTEAQYAANEDCASLVSTTPAETICLAIVGQNFAATPIFTACSAKVTLWYTTEWYDPIVQPSS